MRHWKSRRRNPGRLGTCRRFPRTLFGQEGHLRKTAVRRLHLRRELAGDGARRRLRAQGEEDRRHGDGNAGHGQSRRAYGDHGELTGTGESPALDRGRSSIAYRPVGSRADPRCIGAVRRLRGRAPDRLHPRHRLRRAALCRPRSGWRPP